MKTTIGDFLTQRKERIVIDSNTEYYFVTISNKGVRQLSQISFKILPSYVGELSPPVKYKTDSTSRNTIEQKLKSAFDHRSIF